MRLLVLTADYPPRPWSGIGVAVAAQARALAAAGVETTVLVAGGRREDLAGEGRPGLRVLPLGRGRFPLDPRRFDAVHVHSLRLGELAVELARRHALPLAATAHGLVHRELGAADPGGRWSMAQRRLLRAADRAVLVSAAEGAAAVAWLPEIAARSRVVPNAVEPAALLPAGAAWRPADAAAPVVFAGRFAASKGMDLLAGLVPRLLRSGRRVVLAGGHGDAAGEALARRLAAVFPGRCRLAGWLGRGDLARLLAGAALAVVPSRYEPFGLAAAEALAAGAPVLAADAGGLREVVGEGSGGRRLASRDPRRWAAAAAEMLAASSAGAAGPAWVARRFAPRRAAGLLVGEVYGWSGPAGGPAGPSAAAEAGLA